MAPVVTKDIMNCKKSQGVKARPTISLARSGGLQWMCGTRVSAVFAPPDVKGAHALTSFCFMSSKETCIPVGMVMVELETNLKAFLGKALTR